LHCLKRDFLLAKSVSRALRSAMPPGPFANPHLHFQGTVKMNEAGIIVYGHASVPRTGDEETLMVALRANIEVARARPAACFIRCPAIYSIRPCSILLRGRLIAGRHASTFSRWFVCRVQGRLRGRHLPPHDGASREEPSSVDAALCCDQRCTPSSGMAQPTSRQGRTYTSGLWTLTANQITPWPLLFGRTFRRI